MNYFRMDLAAARQKFYDQLFPLRDTKHEGHVLYTTAEIDELIAEVESAKAKSSKRTSKEYRRLERFDVVAIGPMKQLNCRVRKMKRKLDPLANDTSQEENQAELLPVCALENLFDVLHAAHRNSEHAGRDRMVIALRGQYANITKEVVEIYLKLLQNIKISTVDSNLIQA